MKFFIILFLPLFLTSCTNNQQDADYQLAAKYNTRLGLAYFSQGNIPLAKSKLLRALQQNPRDASVSSALAFFFEQTNDIKLADKYYNSAVKLSSNGGEHLNNYATFLCKIGKFQKADRYFMFAINDVNYADTAKAFAHAGLCSFASGNEIKAKKYFEQALKKDPKLKKPIIRSLRELNIDFPKSYTLRD